MGVSAYLVDYGSQEVTIPGGAPSIAGAFFFFIAMGGLPNRRMDC